MTGGNTSPLERIVGTAVTLMVVITGGAASAQTLAPWPGVQQLASIRGAFETVGVPDQRLIVLVQPMMESDTSLSFRASVAGVEPRSLQPRAHGIKIYVLYKDADIGTAFLRRTKVYYLGSTDELTVDETYFYCNGFLSADIAKVTEKSWSRQYASDEADIARLGSLAEALRKGVGHQEAYRAVGPSGDLLRDGGEDQNLVERELTWFAGRLAIEGVGIELTRSREVGNRVAVRFVQ